MLTWSSRECGRMEAQRKPLRTTLPCSAGSWRRVVFAVLCSIVLLSDYCAYSTELTINLQEHDKQCFHEFIDPANASKFTLDFQVVAGGNYDVSVRITGPGEKELYNAEKTKYDTVELKAGAKGEYTFCFDNEFSSISHKKIYFEFWVGDEVPLTDEIGAHHTALTQLETSADKIHDALRVVHEYQTHHRLRESVGRDIVEHLNYRVQYWSLGETVLFVTVALAQVFILRRFFTTRRTSI